MTADFMAKFRLNPAELDQFWDAICEGKMLHHYLETGFRFHDNGSVWWANGWTVTYPPELEFDYDGDTLTVTAEDAKPLIFTVNEVSA